MSDLVTYDIVVVTKINILTKNMNNFSSLLWKETLKITSTLWHSTLMDSNSEYVETQTINLIDGPNDECGFAFQKDSEFTEFFNYHILKLEESGVLRQIRSDYFPDFVTVEIENNQAVDLGFENVSFTFVVLGFGLLFGIMFIVYEKISFQNHNK